MILFRNNKYFLPRNSKSNVILSVAEIRVSRDLSELSTKRYSSGYTNIHISLPYKEKHIQCLPVSIQLKPEFPHVYAGAWFHCIIKVNPGYPFHPPTVIITNTVYHPNVDVNTGEIYIEALQKENWKPVMTLNSIIFAIELVLMEPNPAFVPDNPMNQELASLYAYCPEEFEHRVLSTIRGESIGDSQFEPYYGELVNLKRKRNEEVCCRKMRKLQVNSEAMLIEYIS